MSTCPGLLAYRLARNGYTVCAIEQDPGCCEFLRDVIEIDARQSDDPAGVLPSLPEADLVVLWHVLEHLPNPVQVIDAAAARLCEHGILVVAQPNLDAFGFRVLKRRWPHVDAPRHLTLLPPDTLRQVIEAAGVRVEVRTSSDPGARFYNQFSWKAAIEAVIPGRLGERLAYHGARALTATFAGCEARHGSSVTMVARR